MLKREGSGSVINVKSGAVLTLIDSNPTSAHKFTPGTDGLWVLDNAAGTETVNGGIITGGSNNWGGGVRNEGGTFKMKGGSIVGCKAGKSGGGVRNEGGTFTMAGGSIVGCTANWGGGVMNGGTAVLSGSITACKASESGGAVQIDGGTLTLQNGKLENCTAQWGGGVYNKSTFTLKGGNITYCTANYGGGVYNNDNCTFTMDGGSITGCEATDSGGGVYNGFNATFTMAGGDITGCKAKESGGVCNYGTFKMEGGKLENCTAVSGGGVYNAIGSFTMEGGSITGCKATNCGGGVYNKKTFNLNSGSITDCTAADGGGVYNASGTFTMAGGSITDCTAVDGGGVNSSDILYANGGSIIGDVSGGGRITRSDDATDYTTFTGTVSATNIDSKACPYTVTFDSKGGSPVATQYVLKGQAPKTVADPTREYFEFVRWHTEGSDTAYDFSTVLTASVELKAKWRDVTAPTGEIKLGTNSWKTFLNNITFGLFFKNTQEVTITAADNGGEAVKIEYLLSNTELTLTELEAKSFTAYSDRFNINPNNEYVIYAKLTDTAGNVTYINSDGIVLDNIAPVISGITDGETYCAAQTVTISDKYEVTVTVNGTPVTLDADGKFILSPASGTQTVVVTDKAGNVSAAMTVTVNDGHTHEWTSGSGKYWKKCKFCNDETAKKDIPEVTVKYPKTVCKTQDFVFTLTLPNEISDVSYGFNFENKSDGGFNMTEQDGVLTGIIESRLYAPEDDGFELITVFTTADGFEFSVTKQIAVQAEHSGGTATCTAKAKCEICGGEYGETDGSRHDLEHNKEKPATVTSTGTKEYWHCKDCEKNFSDKDGKNEITLADTVIPKLAPEITEGAGQSITAGERKELTFRSNAAFADFIRVEVDGETLDEKNYTVKDGSTVVTLKADYVATLSAGVHTLGIVSESGTATTTFTVVAKATAPDSPQTGDNTRIALWIALFFVSGGVSIGTGVYFKRKKRAAK